MGVKKKDIEREYHNFIESWFPKIVERGTLILLSIKDKTEIKEDDLEVLRFFYKNYYNGELSQFAVTNTPDREQNVIQSGLFSDNPSSNPHNVTVEAPLVELGMKVDYPPIETKKEKKK